MNPVAQLVAERLATLPACLQSLLDSHCKDTSHDRRIIRPLCTTDGPVWVTGGGMSEGPAHYLVSLLSQQGISAAFVPLSEFVADSLPQPGKTLVLFSQGLAPNARFPLRHHPAFQRTIVITSVEPNPDAASASIPRQLADLVAQGIEPLVVPPPQESGLLLRVIGPTVQALAAATVSGLPVSQLLSIPIRYQQLLASAPPQDLFPSHEPQRLAIVSGGRYGAACFGLRWKLLEGLLTIDPPIYDLLQVAHGPLQSMWNQPAVLLLLERHDAPHEAPLYARLRQVFSEPRHRVLSLRSETLPGLLAYFEHAAQLDVLLLHALRTLAPPLDRWPGQGLDGPLYDLAPAQLVSR